MRQKATTNIEITDSQRQYLRRIGLSITAVELYELLLKKGRLTAQGAATYTGDFPSAHYRLFYELEGHKLVKRIHGRPRQFEALPLNLGLKSSFQDNERELQELLTKTLKGKAAPNTQTEIIIGRKALYDTYARLAASAQKDICLYSIGIAFSEKLDATQRQTIKRGVRIRHVVQQKKLSNQYVIAKWLRAGVRLRYLEHPRGFHFFIIDQASVCITFSDPTDTENRLSIVTDNKAAIEMFSNNFASLWANSVEITEK